MKFFNYEVCSHILSADLLVPSILFVEKYDKNQKNLQFYLFFFSFSFFHIILLKFPSLF